MSAPGHRVLVPVRVLEGESVPPGLFAALAPVPVLLLGYYALPEQTPPGQASMQFGERAQAKLDDLREQAEAQGATAETRLVFTHEERQSIQRVAAETGCDSFLISNPVGDVERVLVSLRGAVDPARLAGLAAAIAAPDGLEVTLFYAAVSDEDAASGDERLEVARRALVDAGVAPGSVAKEVQLVDDPLDALAAAAGDHDLVAMGEQAPSLEAYFLGEEPDRVATRSLGPVLVLRRPPADGA